MTDMNALKDIDALTEQNLKEGVFTACSLTVYHENRLRLNQAWGYIDSETRKIEVQPDTYFDIASVTKLFTVTALLSILSQPKTNVDLNTPLVEIIPEFGNRSPRPITGGQDPHTGIFLSVTEDLQGKTVDPTSVTLWHLLTHTSGLPPWRDVYNFVGDPPSSLAQINEQEYRNRWQRALDALVDYDFFDLTGKHVHYSDLGLMLLGEVVARLDDNDLDKVIEERICRPLHLANTQFNPVLHDVSRESIVPTEYDNRWRNRRIWGEVHDENACGVGGVAGHAGLFSTAFDVAVFGQAWLTHDRALKINDELYHQAINEQIRDASGRRGLGWMIKSEENSSAGDSLPMRTYGHTGFTGTSLWIDPERQLVVSLMTNRVYHGREKRGIHQFRRTLHDLVYNLTVNSV